MVLGLVVSALVQVSLPSLVHDAQVILRGKVVQSLSVGGQTTLRVEVAEVFKGEVGDEVFVAGATVARAGASGARPAMRARRLRGASAAPLSIGSLRATSSARSSAPS
jgi:hypothetical protein